MNPSLLPDDDYYPLIEARHCDPFRILGIREQDGKWIGRVFRPDAGKVEIILDGKKAKPQVLKRLDQEGLFEGEIEGF